MRTVITYGTFDLWHIGHVNFLRRARALGDWLIVGVSNDAFNLVKGKRSVSPYEQRRAIVEACRWVDKVFEEYSWEQKASDIEMYRADVFVIGDDWAGKFDSLKTICEVVYLPRTPGISTAELKERMHE